MTLTFSPDVPLRKVVRVAPATVPVRIYGSMWSIRTTLIRLHLVRHGVVSEYIDVDRASTDLPATLVSIPSVYVDGEWLHAPRIDELEEALVSHRLI